MQSMQIKNFKDVHKIVNSYMPKLGEVNWFFALDDMKSLLTELGNPQNKYPIVHVAGTSGKTSTSYYIAKMLQLSGQKVGLTVSPHIAEVNERLQVNGQPMPEKEYCELFAEFMDVLPKTENKPTYFGLLVAFAYWAFAKVGVDYAVIEVGMGGRLDATNTIENPNKVCVITDIGLDHTQFLGETIAKITGEKAGIIQPHSVIFMHEQNEDVMTVINQHASQQHGQLHILRGTSSLAPQTLPPFQRRNWSLAKAVVEYVAERDELPELNDKDLVKSADTVIPARMETLKIKDKIVIIDGSHNAQKIGALVDAISQKFGDKKVASLVSFVEGKDATLSDSLKTLHGISYALIATAFSSTQDLHRKAIEPEKVVAAAQEAGFKLVSDQSDPKKALQKLLSTDAKIAVITGSFFLAHELRPGVQELAA